RSGGVSGAAVRPGPSRPADRPGQPHGLYRAPAASLGGSRPRRSLPGAAAPGPGPFQGSERPLRPRHGRRPAERHRRTHARHGAPARPALPPGRRRVYPAAAGHRSGPGRGHRPAPARGSGAAVPVVRTSHRLRVAEHRHRPLPASRRQPGRADPRRRRGHVPGQAGGSGVLHQPGVMGWEAASVAAEAPPAGDVQTIRDARPKKPHPGAHRRGPSPRPSGKVARHPSQEISMPPVLSGPHYLREGVSLVLSPGLRRFVLLPLSVNLILFAALIGLAVQQFGHWVDYFMPRLPDWLAFLEYLLWPLFVVLVLVIVFFTFTLLANLIAAPFNGLLADKVAVGVRGGGPFPAVGRGARGAAAPR